MLRYTVTVEGLGGLTRGQTPSHADLVAYYRERHGLTDPDAVEEYIKGFILKGVLVPLADEPAAKPA